MKLLKLSISNFRGIPFLEIEPNGKDLSIYGANGVGKTTTADAFLWLLFGKDTADRLNFDLIPHTHGTTTPWIGAMKEPVVEALLETPAGTIRLKKSLVEDWPKKGELKGTYTGSTTHFYIDDLEVKAGEYAQAVSELIDVTVFKMLTNPWHFLNMSWQDRRAVLIKIAGDLNVEPSPDLKLAMGERDFNNFHLLAKQQVKTVQKELDGLPVAIREAQRGISDVVSPLPDVSLAVAEKEALEEELLNMKSTDSGRTEVARLELEMSEARNRYNNALENDNSKIRNGLMKLSAELQEKTDAIREINLSKGKLEDEISLLTDKRVARLNRWHEVTDSRWEGSEICQMCGQALPADKVAEVKASFNLHRSEELEQIKAAGIELKRGIEIRLVTLEDLKNRTAVLIGEIETLNARLEKGKSMLRVGDFNKTEEYATLWKKLTAAPQTAVDLAPITARINELKVAITASAKLELIAEQAEIARKRVEELKAEETVKNTDLNKWLKAVAMCEAHVKKSAKALETAVNGKFKIAKFRLFSMQKNGEEAEVCDIIYPNGSTNLSTGERVQTGIDIINTLSEYYKVTAPIFIDNAESVTKEYTSKSQIIKLFVSESDKTLRVECE